MSHEIEESLLSKIHRTVIMEAASGGIANGLDAAMAGAHGTDVTGLAGANVADGAVVHHGPAEGGASLDRPSAGYMAHASTQQSVSLEPESEGISNIARGMNEAGTMTVDGQTIQVLDYMPGGDFVQMAAGQVDPGQMLMKIAQHGISEEVGRTGGQELSKELSHEMSGQGGHGGADAAAEENRSPYASADHHIESQAQDEMRQPGDQAEIADRQGEGDMDGERKRSAMHHPMGQHIPDADENARDLEALSFEHRLDVDTAIQTSDTSHVHTEIHAHGRTLEIDTDFEATKPNNDEERAEAANHVEEVSRGGHDEVNHDGPGMHMRSRIAAHLDSASRDEGLSM